MSGTAVVSLTDFTPAPRYDAVAWASAIIEEAPAASGPWTLLDTIALSPLDADPTTPSSRSFTITNATASTGLWYRVQFVDGAGGLGEYATPVYNGDQTSLLASVEELEARLGIEFTDAEELRAATLLGLVSDLIRGHVRQRITLVTNDVLTIPGSWGDRILLPERPVVKVSSITATFYNSGTPVDLPSLAWYVDKDELVRYAFPVGLDRHFFTNGNGWLGPGYTLAITYDHGYDAGAIPMPRQLAVAKSVALEVAARVWINPAAAAQSTIAGVSASYTAAGLMFTTEETADLRDAFRRQAQTIGLR